MDERPRGIALISAEEGVLGLLVFSIGVLGLWLAPLGAGLVDALHPVIPPYSFHDPQFGWVSMALGISLVVGAMGLSRMAAWGYFMVLLNRFLLGAYCFAYLSLQEQLFLVGYVVPSLLIVAYLVRSRWFFFEAEVPPVQPKKEEVVVPELPRDLAMPSEKAVKAEEIRKILSTSRSVPKTCPNCGEANSIEAVVCYRCGTNLASPEVSGRPRREPQSKGAAQKAMVYCIYCGTRNPSMAEYCFRCGKKIWSG